MKKLKLTHKQQLFVDNYCGNAAAAARKAGYSHPNRQGYRLLMHVDVRAAIIEKQCGEHQDDILSREDRQRLWTRIALGLETEIIFVQGQLKKVPVSMSNRLKALESLAKSQGDFANKIEINAGIQQDLESMTVDQISERLTRLESEGVLDLIKNRRIDAMPPGGGTIPPTLPIAAE